MDAEISAILVSYNTRDLLLRAVRSLEGRVGQVIVVDNASSDGSPDALATTLPWAELIRLDENTGFAAGVNRAAAQARGSLLLVLNPDAAMPEGSLERLSAFLRDHPRAAVAGPSLRYEDGSEQDAAFALPGLGQVVLDLFPVGRLAGTRLNGRYGKLVAPRRVGHPLGACMLIRRAAWEDVGPLDQGYFMYVEEVDWCRRAWARGWEVWHVPDAVVIHQGGASTRQRSASMFCQLWASRLRYYGRYESPRYNAVVRWLVRLGMRAEVRRAQRLPREAREERLAGVEGVRGLLR